MSYLLLILSMLAALLILVLFILVLGLWMKGVSSVALPGLGLIVATPLILLLLLFLETVFVILAAYLVRLIPFARLLFGEIDEIQG
ncbi:MAG: hypothetical protein H0T60_12675 [Acidobacteria bacterium]|nr:hypothetical protein [Acidobacteriota bacterium]